MESVGARLAWFAVAAVVVSYATYLVAGSIVNAQASGVYAPVLIRDELRPNQHTLSGMVMVPSPCDELSVQTQALSESAFILLFTTWREPSVSCDDNPTPRDFQAVVFAPAAGITFTATLDGKALPLGVIPVVADN